MHIAGGRKGPGKDKAAPGTQTQRPETHAPRPCYTVSTMPTPNKKPNMKLEYPVLCRFPTDHFPPGCKAILPEYNFADAIRRNLMQGIRHEFDKADTKLTELLYSSNFVVVIGYRDEDLYGKVLTIREETEWISVESHAAEDFAETYKYGVPIANAIVEARANFYDITPVKMR